MKPSEAAVRITCRVMAEDEFTLLVVSVPLPAQIRSIVELALAAPANPTRATALPTAAASTVNLMMPPTPPPYPPYPRQRSTVNPFRLGGDALSPIVSRGPITVVDFVVDAVQRGATGRITK